MNIYILYIFTYCMGVSQNNVLGPGCGPGNVFTGSVSGYVSGGLGLFRESRTSQPYLN